MLGHIDSTRRCKGAVLLLFLSSLLLSMTFLFDRRFYVVFIVSCGIFAALYEGITLNSSYTVSPLNSCNMCAQLTDVGYLNHIILSTSCTFILH